MAQVLRATDVGFKALTVEGFNVAEALTEDAIAEALPDLVSAGMLRVAREDEVGTGSIVVMMRRGDVLVGGMHVGNLLEMVGLPSDARTLSVDLGCRHPVTVTGALRRALGLSLGDAVAIVRSTGPITFDRCDLVAVLLEVVLDCGRRHLEVEAGRMSPVGATSLREVLDPRVG